MFEHVTDTRVFSAIGPNPSSGEYAGVVLQDTELKEGETTCLGLFIAGDAALRLWLEFFREAAFEPACNASWLGCLDSTASGSPGSGVSRYEVCS